MTVLFRRHRTIGIRLSEEEYKALEKFCVETGARSISDLARTAISGIVNPVGQDRGLALVVNQHAVQVKELEQKLERLSAELAIFKANSPEQESKKKRGGRE